MSSSTYRTSSRKSNFSWLRSPARHLVSTVALLALLLSGLVFAQDRDIKVIKDADGPAESLKGGDDALRHERWFNSGRQVPGKSSADLLYRAYQQKMAMQRLAAATSSARISPDATLATPGTGPAWNNLGPAPLTSEPGQDYGNNTGRVTSMAVDQADTSGNTVYAGGAFGGLWKSTNAAASDPTTVTWTPLLDAQPTLAVGAIAIKPDDSRTLLVGTGETNASVDSYYGLGILRSTDGGANWTLIKTANGGTVPFLGLAFSKIVFNPDNPNLVIAGATSSNSATVGILTTPRRGIYFSTDAGLTWTAATVLDAGTPIAPDSPTSIVYNPVERKFFAAIRRHGFYSSTDGANWSRLPNQPQTVVTGGTVISAASCPTNPSVTSCPMFRGVLAMRLGSVDEMYTVFVDSNEKDQGVFRTVDGGSTWVPLGVSGLKDCGDGSSCDTAQGFYNLDLAALPAGTGNTNLLLATVNIYKCSITPASPTCGPLVTPVPDPTPGWLNLTHVYGACISAHVHPDQHAIAFSTANTSAVSTIYFGNDGGVYRSLDGAAANGSCPSSTPNSFQNLNTNLSLSEFVWFSQDKVNSSVIIGGTQDNGTVATTGSTLWKRVNGGDGGFTDIDPNSPNIWYAENPANKGVSIQRCTVGTSCTSDQFPEVITKVTLGGDAGPFYTPFILDPGKTSNLLIGTCRLWRGPGTGPATVAFPAANALTNNLDTGDATPCTGAEMNTVSTIAAGGPVTGNGSQAIYVGTRVGSVFVSTSADAGPASFTKRVPPNTGGFPISGIAIDAADASGKTAYITVMGFSVSHVLKTTDAGATWTDITANLPDAPADAIVIDPDNSRVLYAGTDTGVYLSPDGGASWSIYGNGLPSVPVTRLQIFKSGATKLLRISTYGRGVWSVTIAAPLVTTTTSLTSSANPSVAGSPVTFTATVVASSGAIFPSGTVTFQEATPTGTITLGTSPVNASGQAIFTTSALSGGTTHTITAVYSGDTAFATSSSSPPLLQVVNTGVAATTTTLVPSGNPSNFSDPVTYTATVTSSTAGVPTGTVVFKDGTNVLATVALNASAQASFTSSGLIGGSHTITATYSGDSKFGASTGTVVEVVNKVATTTTVASANNPSVFGSRVTLSATVTSSNPKAGTPTGSVSFNDGATSLGSVVVGGDGTANFPTSVLTAGTHSITATYVGDTNFSASTSSAISQVVSPTTSSITLTSSRNPAGLGAPVTFTATVTTPTTGAATGNVNFIDGATTIATIMLSPTGVATFTTTTLSAGTHSITAMYVGDANVNGSTSAPPLVETINVNNTTVALASSANPAIVGSSVTFTATVTAPGGGSPTGSVSFNEGSTVLGTGTLTAGVATFTTSALGTGTHAITAVYSGDTTFTGSTSAGLVQSISDFAITANPPSATIRAGQSATFTITLTPISGFNGTVNLACTGLPSFTTCTFTPPSLTPSGGAVTSTLVIKTTGPNAALRFPGDSGNRPVYALMWSLSGGGIAGLVLLGNFAQGGSRRKKRWMTMLALTLMLLLLAALVGCGGGGGGGSPAPAPAPSVTPAGTSTVSATATGGGSAAHNFNISLTVNP